MRANSWLWPIASGTLLVAGLVYFMPLSQEDAIAQSLGGNCTARGQCKSILYVSCQPEGDGPAYYVDFPTGDVISTCGGACWDQQNHDQCNSLCPPPEWTCDKQGQ